jgi:hypothetical protein
MEEIQALMEEVRTGLREGRTEEEIFQSLLRVFGTKPETDGNIAELLGGMADAKVGRVLHRMLEISADKKIRKIIKRSVYRLKSKGIAVEEAIPEKGRSIFRPLQAESPKGFGGSIDPVGQRLLLLALPHPGSGITVMEGVVSDSEGLVSFSGVELSRKRFRTFLGEFQEEGPLPVVEIEPSYVAFLFSEGYQLTLKRKGTPSQDYLNLKSEMEKVRRDYEKPLIYSFLQLEDVSERDWILKKSGDLLKMDLFTGWRIEESRIRPYGDAVSEAGQSKLILNETQRVARFQEIYQKALMELFPEERKFLYKRRLEEMAYVLLKQGEEEEARISLSAAMDLEKPLNPFQPNPFLFQLVIKSIFGLLAEEKKEKEKDLSLIVKP